MSTSETTPLLSPRSSVTALSESTIRQSSEEHHGRHISAPRGVILLLSLFFLVFLATANISVLTTIQSPIAIDLNATSETSWFLTVMLIATASVMPIAGKLCLVFTEPVYLLVSCIISAIGLLLTGLAANLAVFLTGRVLYGAGAAALPPVALIFIKQYAPDRWHGTLFGLMNCAFTAGVACGAILGAVLEPVLGWRPVFWMQCPVVLVLALITFATVPRRQTPPEHVSADSGTVLSRLGQLDYFGMFTLICAVVALLLSLSAPRLLAGPIVLSIAFFFLFIMVESHWAVDPIIPPAVIKSRSSTLTGLATVGVMSARWGVLFYMPAYGIAVRLWSQERAGLLLIPTNIGFGIGGLLVGWLHIRKSTSYYAPLLVEFAAMAGSMVSMALVSVAHSSVWLLMVALLLNGFFIGGILNYSLAHLLHLTPAGHGVIVIPINTMYRSLAGAVGASFTGGIFVRSLRRYLTQAFRDAGVHHKQDLIDQLLARPKLVQQLQGIEKEIAIQGYTRALQTIFYAGAALTLASMVVQACTGWTAPADDKKLGDTEEAPVVSPSP